VQTVLDVYVKRIIFYVRYIIHDQALYKSTYLLMTALFFIRNQHRDINGCGNWSNYNGINIWWRYIS